MNNAEIKAKELLDQIAEQRDQISEMKVRLSTLKASRSELLNNSQTTADDLKGLDDKIGNAGRELELLEYRQSAAQPDIGRRATNLQAELEQLSRRRKDDNSDAIKEIRKEWLNSPDVAAAFELIARGFHLGVCGPPEKIFSSISIPNPKSSH